jgi:hypothetical protein
MTPVEVDTFLAANWAERGKVQASIAGWRRYLNPRGREVRDYERERGEAAIAELEAKLRELREAAADYEARYATDQWERYFLVTNVGGHVHRGMDCTTCYPDTQYAWLIELADCDEDAMVAEIGEKACTVCFPDAPSKYQALKAAGLLTATERRTQAEQEALAAEKAAKAAAKDAKAITAPDGTPLRTRRYGTIRTLVTARNELTGTLAYAMELNERAETRHAGLLAELAADAELLVEAIAWKTGETTTNVRAEHKAKAVKKAARDRREAEKHARRLGLL